MAVIRNHMNITNSATLRPRALDRAPSRPRVRVMSRGKLEAIAFFAAVFMIVFLLTIQTTQVFLMKNQIFNLEKDLNNYQEAQNSVMLKLAEMKNPDRILAIAQRQCDLTLPLDKQFIAVNLNNK